MKKVPVNLNVLVDEAVEHFRLQVEEKGGVIRAELDPEGYVISADEVHMLNVVCNLIDNAIKYSEGSVQIKISSSASSNGYTHISVKDNGMGIPRSALGKIWERFYKSDLSRGKDKKGTGLGLAIVKEAIQAHGENITVVSTEGVGTEFSFSLPKVAG